jgi:hypothetical protein
MAKGTLLPAGPESLTLYSCVKILDTVVPIKPDLTNQSLGNADCDLVTDESSFLDQRTPHAGYTKVILQEAIDLLQRYQVYLHKRLNQRAF